jgi:hypothetical protein
MEGNRPSEGHRSPFKPSRLIAEPATKFQKQSGLADPRLPNDKDDLSVARLGLLKALQEDLKLSLPPHEGRQPALGFYVKAGSGHPGRNYFPGANRVHLPFKRQFPYRSGVKIPARQTMSNFGNHHAPRIGGLLEARCYVRRIADRCVIHSKVASNASHNDQTRVDTLSHVEIDAAAILNFLLISLQGLLDPERRMDGPLRVVLMRDWCAEKGHDAVTEKLVNSSLVPVNLAQHKLECPIH